MKVIFEGDDKQLQQALKRLNDSMRGFDKQAKKSSGKSSGLGAITSALGKLAPLVGVTFAVDTIHRFGSEVVKLGSQMDGVSTAFERVADTGKTSLKELQSATRGTVTDLRLMQLAVQADNFKVPLESLAGLFEFATIRASQTGEATDYLVQSIVTGIGRKSPLILDNLGITLVRLKEAMGKVGRESATVNDIAMATVKIAKEETEALTKLGLAADTSAQKIEKIAAGFQNWKASMGQDATSGNFFDFISEGWADIQTSMRNQRIAEEMEEFLGLSPSDMVKLRSEWANGGKLAGQSWVEALDEAIKTQKQGNIEMAKGLFGDPTEAKVLGDWWKKATSEYEKMAKTGLDPDKKLGEAIRYLYQTESKVRSDAIAKQDEHEKKVESFFAKYNTQLERLWVKYKNGFMTVEELAEAQNRVLRQGIVDAQMDVDNLGLVSKDTYTDWNELLMDNNSLLKNNNKEVRDSIGYMEQIQQYVDKWKSERDARVQGMDGGNQFAFWEGDEGDDIPEEEKDPFANLNEGADEHLKKLQSMASMWGIISQAIGGIADGLNGDSGFSKVIGTFAKLAQTAAATAAAVVAVQTALGKTDAGPKAIAAAVGVATALGGVLSAVGGISTGRASGGNLNDLSQATLHTEISGRNLRIVLDRENSFSSRRG